MVGECLGRVIAGQGVSLVAAEVVAELCAKAHLPPQLVSDRRDAGAQPHYYIYSTHQTRLRREPVLPGPISR